MGGVCNSACCVVLCSHHTFSFGNSMKTVIALDIGTKTGFAIRSKHGLSYGLLNFAKGGRFHDSGFKALYDWLASHLDPFGKAMDLEVVVECPHSGRFMAATRILFGLLAIVHLFADTHGVKLTEVKPKTVKKFWIGSGNAKKPEMVAKTQEKFPKVKDDNTSDAIAILHWYLETQ